MPHDVQTSERPKIALDLADGGRIWLRIDIEHISTVAHQALDKLVSTPVSRDTKTLMMRTAINSALIAIGPMIVQMLWHEDTPAPRPDRKADLMTWYLNFVVDRIFHLIETSDKEIHISIEEDEQAAGETSATFDIGGISTRPMA